MINIVRRNAYGGRRETSSCQLMSVIIVDVIRVSLHLEKSDVKTQLIYPCMYEISDRKHWPSKVARRL